MGRNGMKEPGINDKDRIDYNPVGKRRIEMDIGVYTWRADAVTPYKKKKTVMLRDVIPKIIWLK